MKYIILFFLLISTDLFGSGFDVYVPTTAGSFHSLTETTDHGFLLCGTNGLTFYFEKHDSTGQFMWSKQVYDSSVSWYGSEVAYEIVRDNNGGYIFIGTVGIPLDAIVYIGKLDSACNLLSEITFEGDVYTAGYEMRKTNDSAYIITYHEYDGAGNGFEAIAKLSDQLNVIWSRRDGYGMYIPHGLATGYDNSIYLFLDACSICQLGGYEYSPTAYSMNSSGNNSWSFLFGQTILPTAAFDYSYSNAIAGTYDHGMLICGLNHQTSNEDVSISYIDSTGDSLWTRRIGSALAEQAFDIKQLPDSGYIITGYSTDSCFTSDKACMLMRIDKNGDSLWTRSYHGYSGSTGKTIELTDEGGFLIFCTTDSYYRIIKTDSAGNINSPYQVVCNRICPAFCTGDTGLLTVVPAAVSYHWSTGDTTRSISITSTGFYSVDVTDLSGQIFPIDYGTVSFQNGAGFSFATDTIDACVFYNASAPTAVNSAYSVQWFKNDTLIPQPFNSTITIEETGMYKLVVDGACGISEDSFLCRIHPNPPQPNIFPSNYEYFCAGDSVRLFTMSSGYNFQWSSSYPFAAIPGADSNYYYATQWGGYRVMITDSNGCSSTSDESYLNEMHPDSGVQVGYYYASICQGDSEQLRVCCYHDYLWNTGDTTWAIYVKQPGNYYCTMNLNSSCFSYTDTFNLQILSPPTLNLGNDTSVCLNSNLQLSIGSTIGLSFYEWMDSIVSPTFMVNTSVADTQIIYCKVRANNSCTAQDTITVTVNICLGITNRNEDEINIWPNPTTSIIHFDDIIGFAHIIVINSEGKILRSEILNKQQCEFDISYLPSGIYYLEFIDNSRAQNFKLLKL